MPVDRAALRAFFCGSPTMGVYDKTLYARVEAYRQELLAECRARRVECHLTGTTDAPKHGPVDTPLLDVAAQCSERWPDPTRADGRTWSLPDALEQIALACRALDAADKAGAAGEPAPSVSSKSAPSSALPADTEQGVTQWAADLSKSGVLSAGFKSTPWNTETGPAWPPPIATFAGRRAIKFHLGKGGKRIEVEPDHRTFGSAGGAWFGFQFYLESDFPLAASSWHVIWQLHGNDTTSPKFALQAHKGGLTVGDNGALTPLSKQRWYQAVVFADFSAGRMSVWLDGRKVVDSFNCGRSNPDYYLKVGSYQDTAIGGGTIYQAAHKLGTGYGSVTSP